MDHTSVRVIAKTRFSERAGLVTFVATYPRCGVHEEMLTHRQPSRNAASSRAVPIAKMIERVASMTFTPKHWKKNQKGMSGGDYLSEDAQKKCAERWVKAAKEALMEARYYADMGVHKGIANRPLDRFMYMQTLITMRMEALPHFLNLRNDPDAEDHFRDLADLIEKEVNAAPYHFGWRHAPFVSQEESDDHNLSEVMRVSAVRCRRVSYFKLDSPVSDRHQQAPSWMEDLKQAKEMVEAQVMHSSPFEHPAYKASHPVRPYLAGNLALPDEQEVDFHQFRKTLVNEFMTERKVRK